MDKETKNGLKLITGLSALVFSIIVITQISCDNKSDIMNVDMQAQKECPRIEEYRENFITKYKGATPCSIEIAKSYYYKLSCITKDSSSTPYYLEYSKFKYIEEDVHFIYQDGTLVGIGGNVPFCLFRMYDKGLPDELALEDKWDCSREISYMCL